MEARVAHEVSISDLFDQFVEASTMRNVLSIFHRILNYSQLSPCEFNQFFPKLKQSVLSGSLKKNWKAKALFSKLDKRAAHRCYSNTRSPSSRASCGEDRNSFHDTTVNNNALEHYKCLIIGSGPAGLRTAIELQLLGASKVVVVEKRGRFSRNNVLHLWPFVIDDLKSLGAKKFYGKFCAGSIDHISIRQLQLILLKISLMLGCDFRDSCSYLHLCPSSLSTAINSPPTENKDAENKSDIEKAHSFSDINQQQQLANRCNYGTEEEQASCQRDYTKVSASSSLQVAEEPPTMVQQQTTSDRLTEKLSSSLNNLQELKYISENAHLNLLQQPLSDVKSLDNCRSLGATSPVPTATSIQHQKAVCESDKLRGIKAHFQSEHQFQESELHGLEWDIIIGADGRRNTMGKFFSRKEFRGRLAIAITANFFNRQTPLEASVSEISGLSFIYNQDMFNSLHYDTNIQLENICYYKDDTHYFVMTAKKKSLLERGVLINDYATTQDLLSDSNVNRKALLKYAKDAAHWTTGLEPLEFALNHYGQEDCAMFDFTSMHASVNACKAIRTSAGGLALLGLVGDSLLEPFWPTGSGCARGFLSSFDAAWMCRQWAINKCAVIDFHPGSVSRGSCTRNKSPSSSISATKRSQPTTNNRLALSVLAERESIYRILAQTTSENLHQNYSHWTLNPHTRYPNLNRHHVVPSQVEHLLSDTSDSGHLLKVPASPKRSGGKLVGRSQERSRRIKSPANMESGSRKSPKKLKSISVSPPSHNHNQQQQHHANKHLKHKTSSKSSLSRTAQVQKQIRMLYDKELGSSTFDANSSQYNNNWDLDYFDMSVSGTLPSSNNMQSLEARRARDIDECLRQRRQKSQLHAVKDQLMDKFRNGEGASLAGAAISQELRRLREQRSSANTGSQLIVGKENCHQRVGARTSGREANGSPLSLLNSIRRCASFAERVRSFEEKLATPNPHQQPDSSPVTPKLPLDKVQNLANFATLQELFVGSSASSQHEAKKSRIPIMKLSKEDWNVKCWEDRLLKGDNNVRSSNKLGGSMMSLNRTTKIHQAVLSRPEKQVQLFRGRIKEMAEKLCIMGDDNTNAKLKNACPVSADGKVMTGVEKLASDRAVGSWVSHLKKELIRGVEARKYPDLDRQNSTPLRKPVKKLFENDDDNGLDMSKHYDHLCVNRPTNKYLSRGTYTSHLVRTKYNSATSRVVNMKAPETASKAAYLNSVQLVSPGSSASSTLSDYSSSTSGASGNSNNKSPTSETNTCFRCRNRLNTGDGIFISGASFHSSCLTCSRCALTLRKSEMRHYVNSAASLPVHEKRDFLCSICDASILHEVPRGEEQEDGSQVRGIREGGAIHSGIQHKPITQQASREEFLNRTINYNELYKNILAAGSNSSPTNVASQRSDKFECLTTKSCSSNNNNKRLDLKFDEPSSYSANQVSQEGNATSNSMRSVTLAPNLVACRDTLESTDATRHQIHYKATQTVNGSQKPSLQPDQSSGVSDYSVSYGQPTETASGPGKGGRLSRGPMIDEDELELMMRVGNGRMTNTADTVEYSGSAPEVSKEDTDDDEDSLTASEDNENAKQQAAISEEEASSLGSAVDYSAGSTSATDDDDHQENEDEQVEPIESTYDDFLSSEEFGAPSDDQQPEEVPSSSPDKLHKVSA